MRDNKKDLPPQRIIEVSEYHRLKAVEQTHANLLKELGELQDKSRIIRMVQPSMDELNQILTRYDSPKNDNTIND